MSSDSPHYLFQMVGTDLLHWNEQDFVLIITADSRKLRIYIRQMQQQ